MGYLATYYPTDANWVRNGVTRYLKKYKGENSRDFIHSLVNDAYIVAQTPGNSLDKVPQSLDNMHLPSFMEAITKIETRLGVRDRKFTVVDQLDVLIVAETTLAAENKEALKVERIRLGTHPEGELKDNREMSLLTAEIEEAKRKIRIEEMTRFVKTLRQDPSAVSIANEQPAPSNDYRL